MKNRAWLILVGCFWLIQCFVACTPDEPEPVDEDLPELDDLNPEDFIYQGTFTSNGSYSVSGQVRVYEIDGERILRFENFSSSNGPGLRVFIAEDRSATGFVSLGNLRSTSGNFNYTIPSDLDLEEKMQVLIWCEPFSVLFGAALLEAKQ